MERGMESGEVKGLGIYRHSEYKPLHLYSQQEGGGVNRRNAYFEKRKHFGHSVTN